MSGPSDEKEVPLIAVQIVVFEVNGAVVGAHGVTIPIDVPAVAKLCAFRVGVPALMQKDPATITIPSAVDDLMEFLIPLRAPRDREERRFDIARGLARFVRVRDMPQPPKAT